MSTLNDLKRAGKINYIGVSNFTGWQIQKAHDISMYTMNEPVSVLQTQYNLLDRYPEWEQVRKNKFFHRPNLPLVACGRYPYA